MSSLASYLKNISLLVALLSLMIMIAASKKVTTGETCQDAIVNCNDYNKSMCTGFPAWAKVSCAKTCGLCKCPDGWSAYEPDKTCLRLFGAETETEEGGGSRNGGRHGWGWARLDCHRYGGDLVIIRDQDKNTFVLNMLGNSKWFVWIGLKNVARNGFLFYYVDGHPLKGSNYHPWLPDNPDNMNGVESCVHMYPRGNFSGQWNDNYCNFMMAYVCSVPFK